MADRTTSSAPGPGPLLRTWRSRRRLSQQDLATAAQVSTRHLSFVETGKSRPSRELVLHLARHLQVPLREQNDLLLAAGHAPAHSAFDIDDPRLDSVRSTLQTVLDAAEPNPSLVMDRHWNLVMANASALAFVVGVPDHLLGPPLNVLRLTLHPDGLASSIHDVEATAADLLYRVRRQALVTADPVLAELQADIESWYPDAVDADERSTTPALTLTIGRHGETLRYLSVVSTFGSALDVTVSELTIETFYRIEG